MVAFLLSDNFSGEEEIMNKKLLFVLKILVSITLIAFVFRKINFTVLLEKMHTINMLYVFLALLLILIGYFVSAWRFGLILREYSKRYDFKYAIKYTLIGNFFNNYLPGSVMGDLYRMYALKKSGSNKIFSIYSVLLEKLVGVISIISLIAVLYLFTDIQLPKSLSSIILWLTLILVVIIIAFIMLFIIREKLQKMIKKNSRLLKKSIRVFYSIKIISYIKIFFISVIYQSIVLAFNLFLLTAVGINIDIRVLFPIVTLFVILNVLPISYNGVGVREYILTFFLAGYSVQIEQIALFGLFALFLNLITALIGGILYLRNTYRKK